MNTSRQRAEHTDWSLYFITDTAMAGGLTRVTRHVEQAIEGGAHVIQVRDKHASDDEYRELATAVRDAALRQGEELGRDIRVFVNDRVHIAHDLGLDIHVGQSDMPDTRVREILGERTMIGVSVSTMQELETAIEHGIADVVGIGPVWETSTKTDTQAAVGLDTLTEMASRAREARLASVAIGGITIRNASAVAATGVDGICAISAIATADDPALAATFLRREFIMNLPERA